MSKGKRLVQESLRRIPKPPKSFIEMKVLIHGFDSEERSEAMRGFYKGREDWKKEIGNYISRLLFIRDHNCRNMMEWNDLPFEGEGFAPLEKIEVREMDNKKHGNSIWMILIGFDFYREDGKLKMQKIYIPLKQGWYIKQFEMPEFIKRNFAKSKDGKKMRREAEGGEDRSTLEERK